MGAQSKIEAPGCFPAQTRMHDAAWTVDQFRAVAVTSMQQCHVVVPVQVWCDVPAQSQLGPPDAGAVHVVVLVEVADALLTKQAQVDEVLDLVLEQCAAQGQRTDPVVGGQLEGTRGLGPDVVVAVERVRSFGTNVVRGNLLQRGGLEGLAIASLDGQLGRGLPYQIGTRTGFVAEDLVVVHAHAQGGHQAGAETDLVLQEQRVVIGAVTPVAQAGIDQGLAPRLDAGCQMVPVHPV